MSQYPIFIYSKKLYTLNMLFQVYKDPAKKAKMVDEFKQSKKCIYLPNTSPIMKALDANGSESNGSLDSEDNNGIRYPET